MQQPADLIRNRIVKFDAAVDPHEINPNPFNFRMHPTTQHEALSDVLREIGWVGAAMYNVRTGRLVDGHDRHQQALETDSTMPVLYVDLSEQEEKMVITTFDHLTTLATVDDDKLNALIADVQEHTSSDSIQAMLDSMQVEAAAPHTTNTGQVGDRQIERATVVRIAMYVQDVKTVERALARTKIEDRGQALLSICRRYLQDVDWQEERQTDGQPAEHTV